MTQIPRIEGAAGQCEAVDLVPIADDAVAVRCHRDGRVIREHLTETRTRLRCVCPLHGLATAVEVN